MLETLHQNALNCLSDDRHLWRSSALDHAHAVWLMEHNYIAIQIDASLNENIWRAMAENKSNMANKSRDRFFPSIPLPVDRIVTPRHNVDAPWLWAQNCDNWLTPKWQSAESQTHRAQSAIVQRAGYRQPARQNVIKTSTSVPRCVWMRLAQETQQEQGGFRVTLHFT